VKRQTAQVAILVTLGVSALGREAGAQVMSLPSPPSIVVADAEEWYRSGEPIAFAGALYYPAGAIRHFDGNRMVRTGAHRGVPFYADTTLEPYSVIFVPLAGGLVQPYERRREGDLAGTTGSTAPSFPVAISAEAARTGAGALGIGATAGPPDRAEPIIVGATGTMGALGSTGAGASGGLGTTGDVPESRTGPPSAERGTSRHARAFATLQKPTGLNEIYVTYRGMRWRSAGPAVAFTDARFQAAGEYYAFTVFVERGAELATARRIYLPSLEGLVAPYER
jgi:hypothetical protein